MKRWINGFCWLPLLLILTLPVAANAADYTCTTNNGKITIIDYTGSGGVVTIPDTINGLPITAIEEYAFENSSSLTGVTIPSGVTNIGFGAFTVCNNLTAITVNATNSFYSSMDGVLLNKSQTTLIQCPGGKAGTYTIPSSVTYIDHAAFKECAKLTSITIPSSVTTIKSSAFGNCTKLTSITIPSSVTIIDYALFEGCTGLTSVTIPDSVISISDWAFGGCANLTGITIPASVTSIEAYAFRDCARLAGIYFNGDAPSIGSNIFLGSDAVTIYYLLGAAGWPVVPELWGGRPTALWSLSAPIISSAKNGRVASNGSVYATIYAGNVSGVMNSGVVMFRMPALPTGHKVISADLRMSLYQTGSYPFGVDLYALRMNSSSNIIAADYYSGTYGAGTGRTPIMNNFVSAGGAVGRYFTDASARTNLVAWVQSQYNAGATTNQFVFFCLAPDATAASNQYYRFRGSTTTDEEPLLTIVTCPSNCFLTVNGGTGGGVYAYQQQVTITADDPAVGKTFSRWIGSAQYVTSATSSITTVTMFAPAITLTATYEDTRYALTVTNGNGSGLYTNQQIVAITANTPGAGMFFDRWSGATQYIANVTSSTTTVTMPEQAINLAATYKYSLLVSNVTAAQRPGTKLVYITYDVFSPETNRVTVLLAASNGTQIITATNLTGDVGKGVSTGVGKTIVWNAGADWNRNVSEVQVALEVLDGLQMPAGGDPTAVSWELVNARWVKNIYTNGDVTMSDRTTGLMWHYNTNPCGQQNWSSAMSYCNNLIYAGHSDWRLPDGDTLTAQYSYGSLFPSRPANYYWTSIEKYSGGLDAWRINMNFGGGSWGQKVSAYYVWPVRGGL